MKHDNSQQISTATTILKSTSTKLAQTTQISTVANCESIPRPPLHASVDIALANYALPTNFFNDGQRQIDFCQLLLEFSLDFCLLLHYLWLSFQQGVHVGYAPEISA